MLGGMSRLHSAWLAGSGLLLGVFQCPLDDWGAPFGAVCSGAEFSLTPMSAGANLAGWWQAVDDDVKPDPKEPGLWQFFEIGEGNHPRIFTNSLPFNFDRFTRSEDDVTMGCSNYIDYPLVVGQQNISPAVERHTVKRPIITGCRLSADPKETWEVSPDSRRALLNTSFTEAGLCLHFQVYHYLGSRSEHSDERSWFEMFCFRYDPDLDRTLLSYRYNDGLVRSRWYQRRAARDEGATSQDSTQMSSQEGTSQ